MKLIADPTGRFSQRPFYTQDELDFECEQIITGLLKALHGEVRFPVATDDLLKLIERDAADLDVYADLSAEGPDVEGVTDFVPNAKPEVRISRHLAETPALARRYRTTLTHEYGHVRFHSYLFQLDQAQGRLGAGKRSRANTCHRDRILEAPDRDWMEWQAGHACGAILMPVTFLRRTVRDAAARLGIVSLPLQTGNPEALQVLAAVVEAFEVSQDAARVRLSKLGLLVDHPLPASLFGRP